MPYVSPIVATIDRLGRLYCQSCSVSCGITGSPQHADNGAMSDEHCDLCGEEIEFGTRKVKDVLLHIGARND